MAVEDVRRCLSDLQIAIDLAREHEVELRTSVAKSSLLNYKGKQREYYQQSVVRAIEAVQGSVDGLGDDPVVSVVRKSVQDFGLARDLADLQERLGKVVPLTTELNSPVRVGFEIRANIPAEIRDVLLADSEELERCFKAECYRSCVVLCGRMMETALHRKYFELTSNDLLEKSPGIGLGNLIAKLSEKEVKLDPGLSNQIHLINQVRIFSVHSKQEPFYPTKTQAHAIVLFTIDVIEKLFA